MVFGVRQVYSSDIGFHLAIGKWILANLKVPRQDVFTYTVAGTPYIDLYWLYQVILGLLDRAGGTLGMVLVNILMILVSLKLVLWRIHFRAQRNLFLVPVLLLFGHLAMTFEIRPHVLSWIFLNLMLLVLEYYRAGRRSPLWLPPVLMVAWINSHTLAALGWAVLASYVIGGLIEDKRLDRRLLKYGLIAVAACLVNPYFIEGLILPVKQFGFLQQESIFKAFIGEYRTPFTLEEYMQGDRLFIFQSLFPMHLFVGIACVAFVFGLRRRKCTDMIIFAGFFYILALAFKNFEYFLFAVLPFMVESLEIHKVRRPSKRKRRRKTKVGRPVVYPLIRSALWQRRIQFAVVVIAAVISISVITDAYYIFLKAPYRTGHTYDSNSLPVGEARFPGGNRVEGRLINDIVCGGYLMDALDEPVFIDGRNEVIGDEFFSKYLHSYAPGGLDALIREYRPEIAVFDYLKASPWLTHFLEDSEWRLVHVDELAAVYLRTDNSPGVPALTEQSFSSELPRFEGDAIDRILRRQPPAGLAGLLSDLASRQYYPRKEINTSLFAYANGWLDSAIRIGLEGMRKTTVAVPDLYFNTGAYFYDAGDDERALYCYERFLLTDHDPLAVSRVRELRSR
jgi:hypothetical protein